MKKIFGMPRFFLAIIMITCSVLFLVSVPVQAGYSLPVSVEAEDCDLGNGAAVATDVYGTEYPGYSGDGFVWVTNAGTITLEVDIPENAMYELTTRCWMYLGDEGETRLQSVTINGESQGDFYIPNKGGWIDFSFGFAYLEKGTATIEIGSSGSWGYILYDTVSFDYADMPDLQVDATPCDPNAIDATKSLKQYLASVYGKYVISGQQEIYGGGNDGNPELEFDYIYNVTGKYPAIRGFDLMNYNPLYGWEDGSTDRIIDWTKNRGGIATVCWHINVPADFTSYTLGDSLDWTDCTYKPTDSFNTANCLDSSTKEYAYFQLIIEDLAEQLLILQNEGVPVIFRPFHEAEGYNNTDGSGAWFWWGSAGADVYRELWKYLYTSLTEEYGLHNLIWEVNLYTYANSLEWYPGDAYVDIVAFDKYEGSPYTWGTDAATTVFLTLVDYTNDTKMVAMSENDVIPDIQNIVNEGAWWLYFCPWYGDFIMSSSNNDPALLSTIYNSEYVVTLDEVPSDLYGPPQNISPRVSITSPANGAYFTEGDAITISVDASDSDGEVTLVEFYADDVKIGEDADAPYSMIWENAELGSHVITAKATDNEAATTTSTAVTISVNPVGQNVPPTVSITSPADEDSFTTDETITISVDASDSDGEVTLVEFYADGVKIGEDADAPYSMIWDDAAIGSHDITVIATDNEAATTTSTAITIDVIDNTTTYEEITAPYSQDGIGEFYWKTTDIPSYINSWNLDVLEVNGVDFTNIWKGSADLPPMQDGYYYIHYKGLFDWSHFELK